MKIGNFFEMEDECFVACVVAICFFYNGDVDSHF